MKNKTICEKAVIQAVKRRNTSQFGNPSYWVYFTDAKGEFRIAYTRSNSSIGYTIQNYTGKVNMYYHLTKTGTCIIDSVEELPR